MAVLAWLWDAVAGPVLDRLGVRALSGEPLPRLWWCVSGLLSFLPLHAAGYHDTRSDSVPQTVIDRVVSSYTPTIRALAHARRARPPDHDSRGMVGRGYQVVVVAMPNTPHDRDLPAANAELELLQKRLPGRVMTLDGSRATHDAVLAALPTTRWAHFACHGSNNPINPSASCLLLSDYEQRPLTVVDVARLRLDDADLAFLSACSTARPSALLADEAIHLASAFQLAGYRHVIGTLWSIGDQNAVDLADKFCEKLSSAGTAESAATELHTATRRLRDLWPQTPSIWASHVHCGP